MIAYVPYKQINKEKWDVCITNADNGMIYARSYYLDHMAANWDALVLDDYKAVMPLTWKKKLGIKYLYQPAFIQQGGIFSTIDITAELLSAFLKEAFSQFKFAEITLNYNNIAASANEVTISMRTNFVIDLDKPYTELYESYDPAFTKSLRRIKKFNIEYYKSDDFKSIIQLYKDLYSKRLPYFSENDFNQFEKICAQLSLSGQVITRLAYNPAKELLAGVVLLKDGNRLYNMISCITAAGKKAEANYYLYDKIVEEFAGHHLTLDLEGSDVKGIAGFYKKFNPIAQPYPFVKHNQLHPLLKLVKP